MKPGSIFKFGKCQVGSETPLPIEWEIAYQIAQTKQIIDCRCFDAKENNIASYNEDETWKHYADSDGYQCIDVYNGQYGTTTICLPINLSA